MDFENLFSIRGKAVVVTGGSRGIGYMIAEGFVRGGARVYITARKAEACDEAAAQLGELGECDAFPVDIASAEGRKAFVAHLAEREPELDVLVNNAGARTGARRSTSTRCQAGRRSGHQRHGPLRPHAPFLRSCARPPGRGPGASDQHRLDRRLARSRHRELRVLRRRNPAVHMITRQLSRRVAGDHITVNAIAPGPFPSKMMAFILDEHAEEVAATVPLGRIGQPEDVAGTAIFLASRAGAYLSGTVIPVDGGIQA